MVSIQISLPDDLAHDAQEHGLLESEVIAELLRAEIRLRAFDYILGIAEKLAETGEVPMTPEEVQAEIRAAREENAVRP